MILTPIKLPVISGMKVVKVLKKNGFEVKGRKGSHITLQKKNHETYRTTVPLHKELARGLLNDIIKQSGFTREEFLNLL